jgi:hypothetical protein
MPRRNILARLAHDIPPGLVGDTRPAEDLGYDRLDGAASVRTERNAHYRTVGGRSLVSLFMPLGDIIAPADRGSFASEWGQPGGSLQARGVAAVRPIPRVHA